MPRKLGHLKQLENPPKRINEHHKTVLDAVSNLPLRQKEAVIYYYYDKLSISKTADVMEVSQHDVSRYLALARENINYEIRRNHFMNRASRLYSFLPLGPLLTNSLQKADAQFIPTNTEWMESTLAMCGDYIVANLASAGVVAAEVATTTTVASATTKSKTITGVTIGTIICSLMVMAAIMINASSDELPIYTPLTNVEAIFSDSIKHEGSQIHINPQNAKPDVGDEISVIEWWITAADNNKILRDNNSYTCVSEALKSLKESGLDGEFFIYFRLKNEIGSIYKLKSNFYILTEPYMYLN